MTLEMNGWYEIDKLVQGKRVWVDARYVESVGTENLASPQISDDFPGEDPVLKRVEISPNDV